MVKLRGLLQLARSPLRYARAAPPNSKSHSLRSLKFDSGWAAPT
ncbi:Uncharacterised protein [Mycobacteroides abscessus subsp. bolletii]|nr:Uncharacterised protein [Mycobacteroides abscessus subsp. bolletii]SKX37297.1 Uncharacterised protein [Mycobacteroides abscessus subsp. bolletii]